MKKNNLYVLILLFIVITAFCVFIYPIASNMVLYCDDDMASTVYYLKLEEYINIENGRYILNSLAKFFVCFLPAMLKIHINDFYNTVGAALFITMTISVTLLSSSVFYLQNKKTDNIVYYPFLVANAMFLIIFYVIRYGSKLTSCSVYYSYILGSVFAFAFLYFIYKHYLTDEETDKKVSVPLCFLAFITGCSIQITSEAVAVALLCIIIYNCFIKKTKPLNKYIVIPSSFFLLGLIIMVASPGFWDQVAWRRADSFEQVISTFIPFCKEYFNACFLDYKEIYIVILTLWALVFITGCKQNKRDEALKIIIESSFLLIGILSFYFLLILGGPTAHGPNGSVFWVSERFYYIPYYMVMCYAMSFSFGYLVKLINKHIYKIILVLFIIIMTVSTSLSKRQQSYIIYNTNKEAYECEISYLKEQREIVYKCEKIFVTQLYNDEKNILMPEMCRTPWHFQVFNQYAEYMRYNYNLPGDLEVTWVDDETALNKFYDMGGTIQEGELIKPKFQLLSDKDYVLNKKGIQL